MFRKFNSHFKTPLNFVNRSTNADLAPLLLHSCTVHSEAVHNSGLQFKLNCTVVPHANVYKYHQQNNHAHKKSVVIWQLSHKHIFVNSFIQDVFNSLFMLFHNPN